MQNRSGIIRSTGIIALVFIVVAIAWYLLNYLGVGWVSSVPQQAAADLQAVAGDRAQYLGFLSVDMLYNLGFLALGALLYLILRSFNRPLALFGGLTFVITGAMWLMLDMTGFAQYQLALDYSAASGAAASAIAQRAADLSLWGDYSWAITASLRAIGLFCFGVVILRSAVMNRLLGWLAIIAGIAMLVSLAKLSVPNTSAEGSLVSDIPCYFYEFWILVMGLRLIIRGVETPEGEPAQTAAKA